jgi:hypothetical protein
MIVMAKPMATHCTLGMSARKYVATDGSATPTLPWSATEAKVPTAIALKAYHW